jgi:hypothetical protein
MFGHHQAKRQNRRAKKEKANFQKEKADWEKNSPERLKEAEEAKKKTASERAEQNKADRAASRAEGRKYAEESFAKLEGTEGLDPETRKAMQYEANKSIQRNQQSANRKLLGDQSTRGIAGKSGVGYAQQRDLQKLGMEEQGAAERNLTKLDRDLKLKKWAAMFNIEQGEASQSQLDKQLAQQELEYEEEKRRNRQYEDDMRRYWENTRI